MITAAQFRQKCSTADTDGAAPHGAQDVMEQSL